MSKFYRLGYRLWQTQVHRWLLAIVLGAIVGVAAGRTMIGSVSGSVSVVDGMSMAPTFQPGARIYTAPIASPLERGDIVLLDDGKTDYALKRVIGLPGDTVHLWRGAVFINRRMLREPYLPRFTYTSPDERTDTLVFRLKADEYFVLGDNRPWSVDSRDYGPVGRSQIKSRIPFPAHVLRPTLAAYTLPADGQRTIRPL